MSFSITNNSATAVVTDISTASSTYGTFSVTSGSFPLVSGQTISGTNTLISNLKGSPYGTIQLFLDSGDAQIEVYINSVLYSALAYSSGIASIQVPILQVGDTIQINIDEADLPTPSMTPTPSVTAQPTATPTPSVTPTYTPTPTNTPSSTPSVITPASLSAIVWLDYSNPANVVQSGGRVIQAYNLGSGPDFFTQGTGPLYESTGYLGVSGLTRGDVNDTNCLTSLSGDYASISAFTHFFFFSSETASGGFIIAQSDLNQQDYSGNTQAYRWFSTNEQGGQLRTFNFYTDSSSVAPEPYIPFSAGTSGFGAVRIYQNGADAVTECWFNGSIVDSTTMAGKTILTAIQPIIAVTYNNSNLRMMEQFMFNYKLDNTQMNQMFQYLNDKY